MDREARREDRALRNPGHPGALALRDLVAPLAENEFLDLLRSRTLTLRRSTTSDRYHALVGWQALREKIEKSLIRTGDFRVTVKTKVVSPSHYIADGSVSLEALDKLLDRGASIIFRHLERSFAALEMLCDDIGNRTGEVCLADAVATVGTGGALGFHYDVEDMLVIQLEGSKRWRIHRELIANPVVNGPPLRPPEDEPLVDQVLHPGDWLIVPSGYPHHCENAGPHLSLHLVICFVPPTGYYGVKSLLAKLADDELFRQPLNRVADTASRARIEAEMTRRISELLARDSWLDTEPGQDKY